jgi:hypothetical protein
VQEALNNGLKKRQKKKETNKQTNMDGVHNMVSASVRRCRLLSKDVYSRGETRDRKMHDHICIACLSPKESPVSSFRYQNPAYPRTPVCYLIACCQQWGDKAAAAINHLYRAQGDGSRSRLRIGVLFRKCREERPLSHADI